MRKEKEITTKDNKEDDDMAALAKPVNIAFDISPNKNDDFFAKNTKSSFIKAMENFKKHRNKQNTK